MSPRDVWTQLREVKAGGAIALALVTAGLAAGLTLGGYVGLPARLAALENRVEALEGGQAQILLNTCLMLVEVRGEPNADRCRP